MMKRTFLGALLAAASAPVGTLAQQTTKPRRVAFILTTSPIVEMSGSEPLHPAFRVFVNELRALGYAEGRNLILERRSAEGKFDRFPGIVADLVRLGTEVIVSAGDNTVYKLVKDSAGTVPVVMLASNEPEKAGLVASLARPGGNVTGLTISIGAEIEAKRMELLKEAMPKLARVAYLARREAWDHPYAHAVRGAARALGVELVHVEHTPTDYAAAFAALLSDRPDALFASFSAETYAHRNQIVGFALESRLPGIYPYREMAEAGGLISYGTNVPDLFRRSAHYVDRILKGAKPGDLPIEQPTKFEMAVNLRTATALGITIPRSILVRADRVIE